MTPDTPVWISTARNGISYHTIAANGRRTVCGRLVSKWRAEAYGIGGGHVLSVAEVEDRFGSKPCRTCSGEGERRDPVIRRG